VDSQESRAIQTVKKLRLASVEDGFHSLKLYNHQPPIISPRLSIRVVPTWPEWHENRADG